LKNRTMQIIKITYKTKDGFIKEAAFTGEKQVEEGEFLGLTGVKFQETELPEGYNMKPIGEIE